MAPNPARKLIDPAAPNDPAVEAEVYRLEGAHWTLLETFEEEAVVRAEPFEAIEIPLTVLWEA